MPIEEPVEKPKVKKAGMNIQSAFDRHKTLVNNYLSYHGSAGKLLQQGNDQHKL